MSVFLNLVTNHLLHYLLQWLNFPQKIWTTLYSIFHKSCLLFEKSRQSLYSCRHDSLILFIWGMAQVQKEQASLISTWTVYIIADMTSFCKQFLDKHTPLILITWVLEILDLLLLLVLLSLITPQLLGTLLYHPWVIPNRAPVTRPNGRMHSKSGEWWSSYCLCLSMLIAF